MTGAPFHVLPWLGWGAFATGLLMLIMSGSQGLGLTRVSLPYLLGTVFTAQRDHAMLLGLLVHFVLGCGFALAYGLVFSAWGGATLGRGLILGLYQGLFTVVVGFNVLPFVHPRMASLHHGATPTRQLEPPGFLGLHYGWSTPVVTLIAHLAYGGLLGLVGR